MHLSQHPAITQKKKNLPLLSDLGVILKERKKALERSEGVGQRCKPGNGSDRGEEEEAR